MRPSLQIQILRPDQRPVVRMGETVIGEFLDVLFEETPADAEPVRRFFIVVDDTEVALGRGGEA